MGDARVKRSYKMKPSTMSGLALIFGTMAQVLTMSFHPTHVEGFEPVALARQMQALVSVHVLGLLSVPVLVFGFVGLTRRLGWNRAGVLFAFIVYVFSAVAIML